MLPALSRTEPASLRRRRERLEIQIEQRVATCVVRISGQFCTGADADYLRSKLDEATRIGCSSIVADLARVVSIGSEALSFLVGLYRLSEGRLVLVHPQRRVSEVLGITHLNRIITVVSDLDSGLALLGNDKPLGGQHYNEP